MSDQGEFAGTVTKERVVGRELGAEVVFFLG